MENEERECDFERQKHTTIAVRSLTYHQGHKQANESNERPASRKNGLGSQRPTAYIKVYDENNLLHDVWF